jgi:hypothetical protein
MYSRILGAPLAKLIHQTSKTRPVRQENAVSCRTGHLSGFPIRSDQLYGKYPSLARFVGKHKTKSPF